MRIKLFQIRHIAKNVFVKTREIKSERLFTLESNFFNCSSYEIVVLYSKIEQFFYFVFISSILIFENETYGPFGPNHNFVGKQRLEHICDKSPKSVHPNFVQYSYL